MQEGFHPFIWVSREAEREAEQGRRDGGTDGEQNRQDSLRKKTERAREGRV